MVEVPREGAQSAERGDQRERMRSPAGSLLASLPLLSDFCGGALSPNFLGGSSSAVCFIGMPL